MQILPRYRKLLAAGVPTLGRTILGTVHGGDILLAGAIPDVHRTSIDDVSAFAASLAPGAVSV